MRLDEVRGRQIVLPDDPVVEGDLDARHLVDEVAVVGELRVLLWEDDITDRRRRHVAVWAEELRPKSRGRRR